MSEDLPPVQTTAFLARIKELERENEDLRTCGALSPRDAALLLPHINRLKPARYPVAWNMVDKIIARLEHLAARAELDEWEQVLKISKRRVRE